MPLRIWRAAARLVAIVVLPTPPFGLNTAIDRRALAPAVGLDARRSGGPGPLPSSTVWLRMHIASTRQRMRLGRVGPGEVLVARRRPCVGDRAARASAARRPSGPGSPGRRRAGARSTRATRRGRVSPSRMATAMSRRSARTRLELVRPARRRSASKPASRSSAATGAASSAEGRRRWRDGPQVAPRAVGCGSGLGLGVVRGDVETPSSVPVTRASKPGRVGIASPAGRSPAPWLTVKTNSPSGPDETPTDWQRPRAAEVALEARRCSRR